MPIDAALSKIMDENRFRLLESRMRDSSSTTPTTVATAQSDEEEEDEVEESNVMLVDTPPVFTSPSSPLDSGRKRRQKRNFTNEEDELILSGYEKHPEDWDKIIEYTQLNRNAKQIKSRFSRILKGRARPVGNSPPRKQQRTSLSQNSLRSSQGPNSDSGLSNSPPSPRATTPSLLTESASSVVNGSSHRDDDSDWQRKYQQKEKELQQMKDEYEKRIQKLEETVKQANAQLDLVRVRQDAPKDDSARATEGGVGSSFDRSLDSRTKSMILRFVVENAEATYKLRQLQVWENSARLGKLRVKPHAHRYYEAWEDGSAFQELELRQQQLKERRDKIDAKKKEVSRIKASLKNHRSDSPSNAPDADGTENEKLLQRVLLTEEVLRQQLASLKREETELTSQHQELTFERSLHRKQWKLLYDQEQSVFNSHPLLNQRYALQNLLGRGGFSEVYGAFDLLQQRVVACKIHQLNVNWSHSKKENYRKHALREYQIQKGVSHPRVVRLFDVFVLDESSFCTILEYCDDGDLDSRLKERNKLSEKETRCIVAQIVEGLTYLNRLDHPIIHYDLKPGNILFHQGEVKITDFGLSKIVENSPDGMVDLTSQGAGTRGYLPPECSEMCTSIAKISSKVDVWSLGIICYQMLFGQIPEGSLEGDDLKFPSKISEDCRHFMEQCLTRDQTSRPDVFTIAKSPFLTLKGK